MLEVRLKKIQKSLGANKIDALLVSSSVNIHYLTGYSNFSKDEREAYLFITKSNATLFTDPRYIEAVEKIIPPDVKATIQRPVTKMLNRIVKRSKIKSASWRIGFENNLTFAEYQNFEKTVSAKLVLTNNIVENLRAVKDSLEIVAVKKAAKLTDDTFDFIRPLIKTGVTEGQIAHEIETYIRKYGGTLAFDSIVAFGPNSSTPHHITSDRRLAKTDELILLDFGAKVDGYCSDMTRTLLTKNSSDEAKKMYEAVLEAQKKAAQSTVANKKGNGANAAKMANKVLVSHGFKPVPHSLGHGIGLEVHEEPHLHPKINDLKFSTGNYFSIEPGIYIPGFGGVRIEDDYLLTEQKLEQITRSHKELLEISI